MRMWKPIVIVLALTAAASAEPQVLAPLYRTGNLRVDVLCADFWATPDRGLAVTVDGVRTEPLRINGTYVTNTNDDGSLYSSWSPYDVGYLVEPGPHHIGISAPGCATSELDLEMHADHAEVTAGRLAIDDPALQGPTGAPNGAGITMGARWQAAALGPHDHALGGFASGYTYDPGHTTTAGWLAISSEWHNFAFAYDLSFGHGDVSGTAFQTETLEPGSKPGPFAFTGDTYELGMALRAGPRIALHDVALAAGSGIGFQSWILSTKIVAAQPPFVDPPGPVDGTWFLPVWAAATIKPVCNWGVQVLAEYDVHPTALDIDGFALGAGVIYQPSSACTDAPGLHVSPI
jgi:hypothetical protein